MRTKKIVVLVISPSSRREPSRSHAKLVRLSWRMMKVQKQDDVGKRRCKNGVWRELSSDVRPTVKEEG